MNTKNKQARYCVIVGTKKFYFETVTDAAAFVRKYGAYAKIDFLPTDYERNKEHARAEAKLWQYETAEQSLSCGDLVEAQQYFEKLARRFGLVREFRENGII